MPLHPSLRVGYRVAIAAWLKDQGEPYDARSVDHLVEGEANYVEARNHLAIAKEDSDAAVAARYDLARSTVAAIRLELARLGEVTVDEL